MYRISALVEYSNTSHLARENVGRLKRREGRQEGEEPAQCPPTRTDVRERK